MCSAEICPRIGRVDHRRRDAVDEDPGAGDVLADRLRERDHRTLRRGVGARHRVALLARDRGDVDDAAVAAGLHLRDRGAVGVEDAVQVDRMDALPFLVAHLLGVQRVTTDTRRADEHVEARQPLDRGRKLRRVAHVVSVREVEDVHLGAAVAKALDARRTDPARAAGDERDTSGEVVVVGSSRICIPFSAVAFDPQRDYPLGSERPDLVTTPGGLSLEELTVRRRARRRRAACDAGDSSPAGRGGRCGRPAAARRQPPARCRARAAPRRDDPRDLHRSAPGRSSAVDLESWAERLEALDAPLTAAFVRDALRVYATRGLLAA